MIMARVDIMTEYPSILAASIGLLGESVHLLNGQGVDYAIVGGWSPYFLNNGRIEHPGSRDVDILFKEAEEPMRLQGVVRQFLANGFFPSAKHPFQVLRTLNVCGDPFVFNVDFLHPGEDRSRPDLFVDHLELPIPLREYRSDRFFVKSIAIPQSRFVFDGHRTQYSHRFVLPKGGVADIEFSLIDEVGLIVTKSGSVNNAKRPRDAFDIFIAIEQARDYSALVGAFKHLKATDRSVYNTLYGIRQSLDKRGFGERVVRYLRDGKLPDYVGVIFERQEELVAQKVEMFLRDVELDPVAQPD